MAAHETTRREVLDETVVLLSSLITAEEREASDRRGRESMQAMALSGALRQVLNESKSIEQRAAAQAALDRIETRLPELGSFMRR